MISKIKLNLLNYAGIFLFVYIAYLLTFYLPGLLVIHFYGGSLYFLCYFIGIIMLIVGFYLWFCSIYYLRIIGKGTPHPFYNPPKILVSTGTYKYLRHPIYLGFILLLLGKGLIDNNLLLILELFVVFPALLLMIKIEENTMMKRFKEEYKNYGTKTYRLFPFIY